MAGSGLDYHILTDPSATFAAYRIFSPKLDGGSTIAEEDCDTYVAALWGDFVEDCLLDLNKACQGDSQVDNWDVAGTLNVDGATTLAGGIAGDGLFTGAVCARGATEAQGAYTINDFVGGASGTDEHGATLITLRYANFGATHTPGTEECSLRFDCTQGRAYIYLAGAQKYAFYQTVFYPTTDNTTDIGTVTKHWKDGYFAGVVYADDLELTGDATIDGTCTAGSFKGGAFLFVNAVDYEWANATSDTRNNHAVMDFDDTVDEGAIYQFVMPTRYNGGDLVVTLIWAATSAVAGNAIWRAGFERMAANDVDLDVDSFSAYRPATGAANATCGKLTYTIITFTQAQADSVAAGEAFRLIVQRVGSDGGDTMAGDAELVAVSIQEA